MVPLSVETLTCENCGKLTPALELYCVSCGAISSASFAAAKTVPRKTEPSSLTGQTLSHYQVQERLGAGGMGVVYRALDKKLGRSVALKVLAPHLADEPKAKARFIREARAASALDHPNIATIYEISEEGPILFIAMAMYEGETLRQRLQHGPISVAEAVGALRQMASGLAAAHGAGLVHRDIKPANVMLTRSGTLKLLDFGLAKLVADHQAITVNGEAVGTLLYTAPEQLRGDRVDHRADLWSLGTVFYEMLSGTSPFRGDTPGATTLRILESEPASLISVPGVSSELARVVAKLLRKNPADRFQRVEELIAAIDDGSSAARTAARPVPHRRAFVLAALLALAGAAVVFLLPSSIKRAGRQAAPTVLARRPVIAVMGFKDTSAHADLAWLSTAFSELLSRELAVGEQLVVLSGNSVARAKADLGIPNREDFLPAEAARQLRSFTGAQYAVVGSYRADEKAGAKIELYARLLDTASGDAVLSLHELGTTSELLEQVSRIAAPLRKRLGAPTPSAGDLHLSRASIVPDRQAFQYYSAGLAMLRSYEPIQTSSEAPSTIQKARQLLQKAAELSPHNPLIEARLAEALQQLGYPSEARERIKLAFDNSGGLPREERLRIQAAYVNSIGQPDGTDAILFESFPESLEYGLAAAHAQVNGDAILKILAKLRKFPAPISNDPRIDLLEASTVQSLPVAQELAARAAGKANALGARLTAADAKASEGYLALLAGDGNRAESALRISEQLYTNLGDRVSLLGVLHNAYLLRLIRGVSWTELDQALTLAGRIASQLGGPSPKLAVLRDRVDYALWTGDLPAASAYQGRYEELLRAVGPKPQEPGALRASLVPGALDPFAIGKLGEAGRLVDSQLSATGILTAHQRPQLLVEKGNILLAQGDLAAAQRAFQAALETSRASGAEPDLGSASVGLASIAVEESRLAEAEQLAQTGLDIFVKRGIALFEPAARVMLARALFAEDKREAARVEIEGALDLARRLQLGRESLDAEILSARLVAASKKRADLEKALSALRKVASDASRLRLKYQEFRARQATAEIEIREGFPAGDAHWAALQQDAGRSGFGLFTRLARPARPDDALKSKARGAEKRYHRSKIELD